MSAMNSVTLLQKLIQCKSITPIDDGAIDFLQKILSEIDFKCYVQEFSDNNSPTVKNLYARFGNSGRNLCFAGHTDVVPIGDLTLWKQMPFLGAIEDDIVYGRGAVDMKGAIAAFISAAKTYIATNAKNNFGTISLLITGDEEGTAINGTKKMLDFIKNRGEKIDACIIGEPTSREHIGDVIKVGARGSITFTLTAYGKQGHVAYNKFTENAIDHLISMLQSINEYVLDNGTANFEASNLEITNLKVQNSAENVVPGVAVGEFNIRFNDLHTEDSLCTIIKDLCRQHTDHFHLKYKCNSYPFTTKHSTISNILSDAIYELTSIKPSINTVGGSSDARFMIDICETMEFGLLNRTAHHVDEHVKISDLMMLEAIYSRFINKFFNKDFFQ